MEYQDWLPRTARRHGYRFVEPLTLWHRQHRPLKQGIPQLFSGEKPSSAEVRRGAGHVLPSSLAPVEDLTCLPWVRLPNSMDRLFL
ncbi:hypothetical protein ACIQVF_18185 [Streptomyces tendae]|uniref:hypothetical protein n=1 Tax=Streptomyces tendae TaxID=1932 RepID=UPI00381371B2